MNQKDDITIGIEAEIRALQNKLYWHTAKTNDGKPVIKGQKYFYRGTFSSELIEITIPDSEYTEINDKFLCVYLDSHNNYPEQVYFNNLYSSKKDYLLKQISNYKMSISNSQRNIELWEPKLKELEDEYRELIENEKQS